jgi:hypothetical protein
MGVADNVCTSTDLLMTFIFSLWFTQNAAFIIISKPHVVELHIGESSLCYLLLYPTLPLRTSYMIFLCLFWKKRSAPIIYGETAKSSLIVCKCCRASRVVGTSTVLSAIHHGFHRRSQGYLCFAVAHISQQQPVHGPRRFHVLFYLIYACSWPSVSAYQIVLKLTLPDGSGEKE